MAGIASNWQVPNSAFTRERFSDLWIPFKLHSFRADSPDTTWNEKIRITQEEVSLGVDDNDDPVLGTWYKLNFTSPIQSPYPDIYIEVDQCTVVSAAISELDLPHPFIDTQRQAGDYLNYLFCKEVSTDAVTGLPIVGGLIGTVQAYYGNAAPPGTPDDYQWLEGFSGRITPATGTQIYRLSRSGGPCIRELTFGVQNWLFQPSESPPLLHDNYIAQFSLHCNLYSTDKRDPYMTTLRHKHPKLN